uniref:Uncharacterized protein n=1 Tax=Triticum urartu TaxID=4572 RepID=A0A8R7V0E8_TRIUA
MVVEAAAGGNPNLGQRILTPASSTHGE